MKLTREQRKVASEIIRIGRRRGESGKDIVTALTTGIVESNLTNPRGGHADSEGWRQERRRYYKNPTNLRASINRFYNELDRAGPGSIGARAQAVQRSAFPGRYAEHIGEARSILKRLSKGGRMAQRGVAGVGPGRSLGRTQVIPGISYKKQRQLAALEFIRNRDKPGAIQEFVRKKKLLQDVPTEVRRLPGKQKKLQTTRDRKSQAQVDDIPLHGDAIKIGKAIAKKFGLTVTSTTGGNHVAGSYHYQGRAVDIAGPPDRMRAAYRYLNQRLPRRKKTELFYDPAGFYWDNGRKIKGQIGNHSDHIHLAI